MAYFWQLVLYFLSTNDYVDLNESEIPAECSQGDGFGGLSFCNTVADPLRDLGCAGLRGET